MTCYMYCFGLFRWIFSPLLLNGKLVFNFTIVLFEYASAFTSPVCETSKSRRHRRRPTMHVNTHLKDLFWYKNNNGSSSSTTLHCTAQHTYRRIHTYPYTECLWELVEIVAFANAKNQTFQLEQHFLFNAIAISHSVYILPSGKSVVYLHNGSLFAYTIFLLTLCLCVQFRTSFAHFR